MGMMDKLKGMLKGHEDKASKGVDKAGDMIDDRTGGKYKDKVDTAQDKLKDQFGGGGEGKGDRGGGRGGGGGGRHRR